jgi:hypothetical protein
VQLTGFSNQLHRAVASRGLRIQGVCLRPDVFGNIAVRARLPLRLKSGQGGFDDTPRLQHRIIICRRNAAALLAFGRHQTLARRPCIFKKTVGFGKFRASAFALRARLRHRRICIKLLGKRARLLGLMLVVICRFDTRVVGTVREGCGQLLM